MRNINDNSPKKKRKLWKWILGVFIGLYLISLLVPKDIKDKNKPIEIVNKEVENKEEEKKNCTFKKVEIKAYQVGTDKLLNDKTINDCFNSKIVDKTLGLVEITNESKTLKVSYYIEKNPKTLRILDVKIGNDVPSRWRANKGHDLFIMEKEDFLSFIFGDRNNSKIKGSIKFIK